MRSTLLVAAIAMVGLPLAGDSEAKRRPPPEIKFCKKSKRAVAVATFNDAGRLRLQDGAPLLRRRRHPTSRAAASRTSF